MKLPPCHLQHKIPTYLISEHLPCRCIIGKVQQGINPGAADINLKVQMRTCGHSCATYETNRLALRHRLSDSGAGPDINALCNNLRSVPQVSQTRDQGNKILVVFAAQKLIQHFPLVVVKGIDFRLLSCAALGNDDMQNALVPRSPVAVGMLHGFYPVVDFRHIPKHFPDKVNTGLVDGDNIHAVVGQGGFNGEHGQNVYPDIAPAASGADILNIQRVPGVVVFDFLCAALAVACAVLDAALAAV